MTPNFTEISAVSSEVSGSFLARILYSFLVFLTRSLQSFMQKLTRRKKNKIFRWSKLFWLALSDLGTITSLSLQKTFKKLRWSHLLGIISNPKNLFWISWRPPNASGTTQNLHLLHNLSPIYEHLTCLKPISNSKERKNSPKATSSQGENSGKVRLNRPKLNLIFLAWKVQRIVWPC